MSNAESLKNSGKNFASPDAQIDLRGTPCPLNFVRTKLRLEQMAPGSLLEVWLDPGEPIEQVPDSLAMEGYSIEQVEDRAEFFALRVRRPNVSA
uniref:sulfurtransferase TusA family protein n=1 Tax=Trichocoleus desertorum TaxID=1481672 RepID=UPI0025B38B26|nr:sulfurtransferase TusA family protein [Trichocoleus desertorum]